MSKKLIFILLMSGVILSPMTVHAMDDEGGAPKTSISRASPSTQPGVEESVPPISIRGMTVSPGERLKLKGDEFVNNAGTIAVSRGATKGEHKAIENGDVDFISTITSNGAPTSAFPLFPGMSAPPLEEHPGLWQGQHYIFEVEPSGSVIAFPYVKGSAVPLAAPAPQIIPEYQKAILPRFMPMR